MREQINNYFLIICLDDLKLYIEETCTKGVMINVIGVFVRQEVIMSNVCLPDFIDCNIKIAFNMYIFGGENEETFIAR